MDLEHFFLSNEWGLVTTLHTDPRPEKKFEIDDLSLSSECIRYLGSAFPEGLYQHQKEAIKQFMAGRNVCMTTSTASGKSLAFFVAAIEKIVRDQSSRILAIYPMRALGREQEDRWKKLFRDAAISANVGRIDGSIKPISRRPGILSESQVVVCTPDILHAWLLSHLGNRDVQNFLKDMALVIVDEVHTYTGVFGSNAAFLFRRIQHLMRLLGASPQYICSSATFSNPVDHLRSLFGLDFNLVDQEKDTSPAYGHDIHLVNSPGDSDFISEVVQLLQYLAAGTDARFINFVDSRKQVELISSILARSDNREDGQQEEDGEGEEEDYPEVRGFNADILDQLHVLPYRAGYEERDRRQIQKRLTSGTLNGVVSTSALELGIDIPHLDTCVLLGVPHAQTSLHQRIGRVGRKARGTVVVINTGDVHDEAVFRKPDAFLNRPLAESALYLENEYIQYIHALCLARLDGEHDEIASSINLDHDSEFSSKVVWPEKFIEICNKERTGQIPKAYQIMKAEAGESPNYTFPLRDIGSQFKVEIKRMRMAEPLGSLSFSQLMREAYPGAVYYYATEPYRVYRVRVRSRQVDVRKDKHYTTRPLNLPALVFPNLTADNVHNAQLWGDLVLIECDLQIRESICGFKERRGPNEFTQNYPVPVDLNIYFDQRYFTRTYFSTGVVFTHPVFNEEGVNTKLLAELLYEAFLLIIPFERRDINYTADKHRTAREPLIEKEDRFITIFDETYGSLRLTGRLLEEGVLGEVLQCAKELALSPETGEFNLITVAALDELIESIGQERSELVFDVARTELVSEKQAQYDRVILPGSKGLNLNRDNEEFFVERVFLSRDGLRYEGITDTHLGHLVKTACMPLVSEIVEIPGVSEIGLYNYDTGQIEELPSSVEIRPIPIAATQERQRRIDIEKLRFVLSHHFTESDLIAICQELDLDYLSFSGDTMEERVDTIVAHCDREGMTFQLLETAFRHYNDSEKND